MKDRQWLQCILKTPPARRIGDSRPLRFLLAHLLPRLWQQERDESEQQRLERQLLVFLVELVSQRLQLELQ